MAGRVGGAAGLAVESDNLNNVLITLHASPGYERRPGVVLQAHMDMVCQKAEGSPVVRQPSSSNNA